MSIQPGLPSGGNIRFDAGRFHDEPERSVRIPCPPAIAFCIVSKVAITSAGIELRQCHRIVPQIKEWLQRPPSDHLSQFVQLESHDLKAHGVTSARFESFAVSMPIITVC
jgi:hypothetical protein